MNYSLAKNAETQSKQALAPLDTLLNSNSFGLYKFEESPKNPFVNGSINMTSARLSNNCPVEIKPFSDPFNSNSYLRSGSELKNYNNAPGQNQESNSALLNNSSLSLQKGRSDKRFVMIKEQDIHSEDVDFWLLFEDNSERIKANIQNLMEMLKNQFEGLNIVKIRLSYYLETTSREKVHITGWKLTDDETSENIIRGAKKLVFHDENNKPLEYSVIKSKEDLIKHLRRNEMQQKLNQNDLFQNTHVAPLLKLHIQGLSFYEFDYLDICPDTVCILCGIPVDVDNNTLRTYLQEIGCDEPVDILQNSLEDQTCLRLSFDSPTSVEVLKNKGLKIPLESNFGKKPIITMFPKERSFDYFTEVIKYQVMMEFNTNENTKFREQIDFLTDIQTRYGLISDVNIVFSQIWIVTFLKLESASKCLDQAEFEQFSVKTVFSRPPAAYMLQGYLFQNNFVRKAETSIPARPAPLIKTDPNRLKIRSSYFEQAPALRRRYQKIFLRQQENSKMENLLPNPTYPIENSAKNMTEPQTYIDETSKKLLNQLIDIPYQGEKEIEEFHSSFINNVTKSKEDMAEIQRIMDQTLEESLKQLMSIREQEQIKQAKGVASNSEICVKGTDKTVSKFRTNIDQALQNTLNQFINEEPEKTFSVQQSSIKVKKEESIGSQSKDKKKVIPKEVKVKIKTEVKHEVNEEDLLVKRKMSYDFDDSFDGCNVEIIVTEGFDFDESLRPSPEKIYEEIDTTRIAKMKEPKVLKKKKISQEKQEKTKTAEKKHKTEWKQSQSMIKQNIEKIKELIKNHGDVVKKKKIKKDSDTISVNEWEASIQDKQNKSTKAQKQVKE